MRFVRRALAAHFIILILAGLVSFVFMAPAQPVYAEEAQKGHEAGAASQDAKEPAAETVKENPLIASVARRQKELDKREEEVRKNEERLKAIKGDIEARITELNGLHGRIDALVKKIEEVKSDRIRKITKIFESMPPEEVSPRVERLPEETAVMVLAAMNEKKAAKILGLMNIDKSVKLTEKLKIK